MSAKFSDFLTPSPYPVRIYLLFQYLFQEGRANGRHPMSQGLSLPIGKRHSAAASAAPPSGGILPRFWVGTFFEQLD